MSSAEVIWHRKTDDEVIRAAASVDEYTAEGKRAVLDEMARRGLNVAEAPAPSRTRATLAQYYLGGWVGFARFRGRAGRQECFTFVISNVIIFVGLFMLDWVSAAVVLLIAIQLPQLALNVRRLHDTGKSGWWLLVGFIPLVGWIGILAMLLNDGEPGENQYGAAQ